MATHVIHKWLLLKCQYIVVTRTSYGLRGTVKSVCLQYVYIWQAFILHEFVYYYFCMSAYQYSIEYILRMHIKSIVHQFNEVAFMVPSLNVHDSVMKGFGYKMFQGVSSTGKDCPTA